MTPRESFADRHIGADRIDQERMLKLVGRASLDDLVRSALPPGIQYFPSGGNASGATDPADTDGPADNPNAAVAAAGTSDTTTAAGAGGTSACTDRVGIVGHTGATGSAGAGAAVGVGDPTGTDHINTGDPAEATAALAPTSSIPEPLDETATLAELRRIAGKNTVRRSLIGQGYYGTITPAVIQRNVLENPSWYTAYTPYQPEISQGRLEALINFQQMITDLTGLDTANASMLDEATAVVEGMLLARRASKSKSNLFLVDADIFPQTRAVLEGRATALGIELRFSNDLEHEFGEPSDDKHNSAAGGERGEAGGGHDSGQAAEERNSSSANETGSAGSSKPVDNATYFGALVQYPGASGRVWDPSAVIASVKAQGGLVLVAADLLALALLKSPGELGADIAVGSSQRFGVPMGYGGPHAGYLAVRQGLERQLPGRLVGVSQDAAGAPAYRLTLQTREQHIRREKATSNICTAQVLLAVMASMYAVYHGPDGIRAIAQRVHDATVAVAEHLRSRGAEVVAQSFFDTLQVNVTDADAVLAAAYERNLLLWKVDATTVSFSLDEAAARDLDELLTTLGEVLAPAGNKTEAGTNAKSILIASRASTVASSTDTSACGTAAANRYDDTAASAAPAGGVAASGSTLDTVAANSAFTAGSRAYPALLARTSPYLTHPVFNSHHSETAMMRYLKLLADRDYALDRGMIPLGSCTMKLNAATEMAAITWPEFAGLHPFAPAADAKGYRELIDDLERWLAEATGYDTVSLQPNAGSQGELAGLLAIRGYHLSRGDVSRTVCLIPQSAHGTNAASAALAGLKVVVVATDAQGNVDLNDLRAKIAAHADELAALMITYPSTHGVYEHEVAQVTQAVHDAGGQVYVDGANLNALLGFARFGDLGGDVSHLNLHKTFCIPHGGGGPGVGPVAAKAHLAPFLPGHPLAAWNNHVGLTHDGAPVSAAPFGSPSILPISWAYIRMMGIDGLARATASAVLAANYVAARLSEHYPVLYTGPDGLVAHECILDLQPLTAETGVTVDDVAKRLIDYGFHAPTMSFPVAGTLMVEPTESEDAGELDRFCDAMLAIEAEARDLAAGKWPEDDNPLHNAPHTAESVVSDSWNHPYSRELAVYPAGSAQARAKYWPPVRRIDNAWGDRNLFCGCPPVGAFA